MASRRRTKAAHRTARTGRRSRKRPSCSTRSASARRSWSCGASSRRTRRTRTRTTSSASRSSRSARSSRRATPTPRASSSRPAHLGARVALCHVLRMLGRLRGAIREGLAALSRRPATPTRSTPSGLAYHARGDDAAARKYLEAFLATNPEFEVGLETKALLKAIPGGKPEQEDERGRRRSTSRSGPGALLPALLEEEVRLAVALLRPSCRRRAPSPSTRRSAPWGTRCAPRCGPPRLGGLSGDGSRRCTCSVIVQSLSRYSPYGLALEDPVMPVPPAAVTAPVPGGEVMVTLPP